ncbi:MAG: hypothetical protein A2X25_09285 [Chloroflexi bacterium GWB2_49_20]|nr:MAG: hypothetical protein A2X25_09285 [Chloroflexi bacterium GWB2_49_20]OGN79380.1 MAG: hypothetical protein A2X26_04740 [Chloroflexi bacterium GWC2_49_37]OGN82850.1 MAG: hypothetical protein A2X27_07955 [Chloroflexi bacterium GWD2_49_16]HCC78500.1 hypothetical protein [Anaerolineae bacterium]HCM97325.1 hypothetical protein [Anaerolineae bacterium]
MQNFSVPNPQIVPSPAARAAVDTLLEIQDLHDMLEKYNQINSDQTEKMIRLTNGIAILTFLMVIGLVIQIWLSLK